MFRGQLLLSILIPTFNRSYFLMKNLKELSSMIIKFDLLNNIQIIISNNNSSDDTSDKIQNFILENKKINIKLFDQKKTILF